MARVIVLGGGVVGISTALMLEKQGHEVTVLERDPAPPPETPDQAWKSWERHGVMQFRQPHALLPGGWRVLRRRLPEVAHAFAAAGAVPHDPLQYLPPGITDRAPRPGDDKFKMLNARRPVLEQTLAAVAAGKIEIRRGVPAAGLVTDRPGHVAGVLIHPGTELKADLVIDAMGRRSPLPDWLSAIGAERPYEEIESSGFMYYTRFFQARANEEAPSLKAGLLTPFDAYSILSIPSDAKTWSVTVYISSRDKALKTLRETANWDRMLSNSPLHAHLTAGKEPITKVLPVGGFSRRLRGYVVNELPVATGIIPVGDAWACTDPSLGRGISLGLMHAEVTASVVGEHIKDPAGLALAHDRHTKERLVPWYQNTVRIERDRLAQINSAIGGRPRVAAGAEPDSESFFLEKMAIGMTRDPAVFRAFIEMTEMLALPAEIVARAGMAERIHSAAADGQTALGAPGPARAELVAMLA